MAKFLVYFAVIAVAVLGALAEQKQCRDLNFVEKSDDIDQLNSLVNLAVSFGIVRRVLRAYDPLDIKNKTLDAVPFSALSVDFEVTPTIEDLKFKGVSTLVPRAVNVSSPSSLEIGANFKGELNLDATVKLSIRQLDKKWYDICWTNPLKPKSCPPAEITMDINLGLDKPTLFSDMTIAMLQCPVDAENCKDITMQDVYSAAWNQDFDGLIARVLRRLTEVSARNIAIRFDQITDLGFHFHSSSALAKELAEKVFGFTKEELNKKGDVYNIVMGLMDKLIRTLANKVIAENFASRFGQTCYDA